VRDSVAVLQQQLQEAQAQAKRLIGMNRQLVQHAEALGGSFQQQAAEVAALKEDKAAMAAELSNIYIMLQDMQGAQQRQQLLQQQLLQLIALQQARSSPEPDDAAAAVTATAAQEDGSDGPAAGTATVDGQSAAATAAAEEGDAANKGDGDAAAATNPLIKALSGAVLGAALPLVGQFLR
jgi:chromosome segregation ATPase